MMEALLLSHMEGLLRYCYTSWIMQEQTQISQYDNENILLLV